MIRRLAFAAAVILAAVPCVASEPRPDPGTENAVQALAADVARHPQIEAADLYKFLHQALYGPGHAIPDRSVAEEYLAQEIAGVGPALPTETSCNMLGGDPLLVRVNLRPYLAHGFNPENLLASFVETANEVQGNPEQMALALDLVIQWLLTEGMDDLSEDLSKLAAAVKDQGYPAIHHSERYGNAYHPAYRVVAASKAAAHGWCGSAPR